MIQSHLSPFYSIRTAHHNFANFQWFFKFKMWFSAVLDKGSDHLRAAPDRSELNSWTKHWGSMKWKVVNYWNGPKMYRQRWDKYWKNSANVFRIKIFFLRIRLRKIGDQKSWQICLDTGNWIPSGFTVLLRMIKDLLQSFENYRRYLHFFST